MKVWPKAVDRIQGAIANEEAKSCQLEITNVDGHCCSLSMDSDEVFYPKWFLTFLIAYKESMDFRKKELICAEQKG